MTPSTPLLEGSDVALEPNLDALAPTSRPLLARYFYVWMPVVVVVGTIVVVAIPYLVGLLVLAVLVGAAVAGKALARRLTKAPYALVRSTIGRSVTHRTRERSEGPPPIAPKAASVEQGGIRTR
jgi:hypothetical protein